METRQQNKAKQVITWTVLLAILIALIAAPASAPIVQAAAEPQSFIVQSVDAGEAARLVEKYGGDIPSGDH
jgi:hypothetical protein